MKIINTFLLALTIFFTISCTEIIDISVVEAKPELVVEAFIGADDFAQVLLTNSIGLVANDTTLQGVSNAQVSISNSKGEVDVLTEVKAGTYVSDSIKGVSGETYQLHIKQGEKIITATSTIPPRIMLDSVRITKVIYPTGGQGNGQQKTDFFEVNLFFVDPAQLKNYYRVLINYNGKSELRNLIFNDRFNDGKLVKNTLYLLKPESKRGDTISVELQCIDKPVFTYFESMGNSAMGPRNSSSPANPYTNLVGNTLGYFSAHTVERKDYIVP
ncbi:MAG: hypothetical protein AUK44_10310 [Porphyromonadaceae bacterium CG2_30_38_12]|nr:MAG: hypothetical protein AUK44_10310 [Porphyromonadaceae bacterium CG2_30_38_12]